LVVGLSTSTMNGRFGGLCVCTVAGRGNGVLRGRDAPADLSREEEESTDCCREPVGML
jgi:hypothetical protein